MLRKIKFKEFKQLYRKNLINDFPKNERPNLKGFRKRILKGNEEVYIFEEDGIEKGYCITDKIQEYVLVAFLAVFKEQRGKGIGTKMLKDIKDKYKSEEGILLEVEDPDSSDSEEEKIIKQRRIKFYERANFEMVKDLKIELFKVDFRIMVSNDKSSESWKIAEEIKYFYNSQLNKKEQQYLRINLS